MATGTGAGETTDRSATRPADATLAGTRSAPAHDAVPAIGRGVEIGRYLIMQELGRGATGRVWSAYDGDLDRKVAIKVVAEVIESPERRKRLLGEAQAMAKIRHPNVVLVHDVGTHEGHLYIAMEFVEGTTLGRWCHSEPPPPSSARLDAMTAAARGLAAAHAVGLVHRDFKPDNVLVDREGRVRVADFGLAQSIERNGTTDDGARGWPAAAGTPAYMSPEHHGLGVVDARSDQFSFSVALFEALAGRRPFAGNTIAELAAAAVQGEIDVAAAATIPPRIRRVIARGLAVRPEHRHATMDELITALERARRPRWPLALGVPAVLGLAALVWGLGGPGEPTADPCALGAARANAVWSDTQREQLQLRDGELSPKVARAAELRATHQLDGYATGWAELHDEICARGQAAHGEDPTTGARLACVEDRLAGFRGLVEFVTTREVEAEMIEQMVETLPPLAQCRRNNASAWQPFPTDPELAVRVAAVRERIRGINLRLVSGELTGMLAELETIVAAARETGYAHAMAAALSRLAWVEDEIGRTRDATAHYDEALRDAIAGGHDWLAATIISEILQQMGHNPSLDVNAERWATIGEALLERDGGDDQVLADICSALGGVLYNRNELRGALEQHQRAEALYRRAGADDEVLANVWLHQAAVLSRLSRADEAWTQAELAATAIDAYNGPDHMRTIHARHMLAAIEDARGNLDRAIAIAADAAERAERTRGPQDRELSTIAYNLAQMYARRGNVSVATATLARSRRAWPVADDHYSDAQYEEVEMFIASARDDDAAALRHIDHAIDLYVAHAGDSDGTLAAARLLRVNVLFDQGRWREVLHELDELWPRWHDAPFFNATVGVHGTLAAHAGGDSLATAVWLARMEALPVLAPDEPIQLRFARAVVQGDRSEATTAALLRDRDRLIELSFAGARPVRRIEQWIAGAWPHEQATKAPR